MFPERTWRRSAMRPRHWRPNRESRTESASDAFPCCAPGRGDFGRSERVRRDRPTAQRKQAPPIHRSRVAGRDQQCRRRMEKHDPFWPLHGPTPRRRCDTDLAECELVSLYWQIGKDIVSRQKHDGWGKSVIERLASDIQNEFPGIQGFSSLNLWRMRGSISLTQKEMNFYRRLRQNRTRRSQRQVRCQILRSLRKICPRPKSSPFLGSTTSSSSRR